MEIQTSSLRIHADKKDTPSPSPLPPPEDRPISSTYPASQKKTAISRTEAQTIAAATEEEEAEKRAAAHQPRAIPQVRYDSRHPTAATRSRAVNTQRCSEVQGRCVVLCWSCLFSILFLSVVVIVSGSLFASPSSSLCFLYICTSDSGLRTYSNKVCCCSGVCHAKHMQRHHTHHTQ